MKALLVMILLSMVLGGCKACEPLRKDKEECKTTSGFCIDDIDPVF